MVTTSSVGEVFPKRMLKSDFIRRVNLFIKTKKKKKSKVKRVEG